MLRAGRKRNDPPVDTRLKAALPPAFYKRSLRDFQLSERIQNCLYREGVFTIKDLLEQTEWKLFCITHLGPASVREIKQFLAQHGLTLKEE
jgi:DNA-directed RNA polymerase alpha subunit